MKHIPNILTVSRVALTLIFLVMLLFSGKVADRHLWLYMDTIFVLFVISGITDLLDGHFARLFNVASKFGRMLDPLADKILVCGAFFCFAAIGQPVIFPDKIGSLGNTIAQWSVFGIITARELYVTWLRHSCEAKGIKFPATLSGKLKMFVQSFAIGTVIIKIGHVPTALWGQWFTTVTLLAAVWVTIASGFSSIQKDCRLRSVKLNTNPANESPG